jgi:hyperosmotically inducible protein
MVSSASIGFVMTGRLVHGARGVCTRTHRLPALKPQQLLPATDLENHAMNQLKRISAVALAVILVSVTGCMSTPTQEGTGEYVTDSWITTKVKTVLVEDANVKATEVNVETFKGVVQLSGFVSSQAAMYEAVRLAGNIKGVTSVKNDMRIK